MALTPELRPCPHVDKADRVEQLEEPFLFVYLCLIFFPTQALPFIIEPLKRSHTYMQSHTPPSLLWRRNSGILWILKSLVKAFLADEASLKYQ